jgi:hypothetical protein
MVTLPGRQMVEHSVIDGTSYDHRTIERVYPEEVVPSEDFALWILTGSRDLTRIRDLASTNFEISLANLAGMYDSNGDNVLARPIPEVEREIMRDVGATSYATGTPGMDMTAMLNWAYRVTGLRDFRIVAHTPLFGQPAESDVTKFFSILEFDPHQIISSRTNKLVWGIESEEEVTDIRQWIRMEPYAPPAIVLKPNREMTSEPIAASLEVILTTTEGNEVRSTMEVRLK